MKKWAPTARVVPFQVNMLVLGSLVLPLLIGQNRIMIFVAGLSVLMLWYADYAKNRWFILASLGTGFLIVLYYLIQWGLYYVPALAGGNAGPDSGLVLHGIIGGLAASAALAANWWLLANYDLSTDLKKLSRHKVLRINRILLLIALFLAMAWISISLTSHGTGSTEILMIGGFISGCLFFIGVIRFQSGKKSSLRHPIRYLAFLFGLSYPFLVHWAMIIYRDTLSAGGSAYIQASLLHYLALALLLVLGWFSIPKLYRQFSKNAVLRRVVQSVAILFILFLLVAEYDNLSVLIQALRMRNNGNIYPTIQPMLEANKYLPYSILLAVGSLAILVWAVIKQFRFVRSFAIVMFLLVIVKIFALDFIHLTPAARTGVLIGLGLLLVGISMAYPKLRSLSKRSPVIPTEVLSSPRRRGPSL
jgi:hypothetical protein